MLLWTAAVTAIALLFKHLEIVLRNLELVLRLQAATPALDAQTAYTHVAAAEAAASAQVPTEILLGMAFVESRFDPTAVSRVQAGVRRTGRYPSRERPARLDRRASLYCGPLQTLASSWSACLGLRDVPTAYAAGAAELTSWLRDRRVRGDVSRALAGHGCGNHGLRTGHCNGYPQRVLSMARQFQIGGERRPARAAVASM